MRPWFAAFLLATLAPISTAHADLGSAIAHVKPAIVMVGSYLETANPRFTLFGTGFAVAGDLVATNGHVVDSLSAKPENGRLVVVLAEGAGTDQMRSAALHSVDDTHDLALLRIDGPPLPFLELGDSDSVREGHAVAFTGFPIGAALGFSPVTHRGIVSAITSIAPPSPDSKGLDAKRIRAIKAGSFPIFQLDATAYPGNSGGPLFDPGTKRVLGVINMVFVKGVRESVLSQPSGISYAIPARFLVPMVTDASASFTLLPSKP